MQLFYHVTRDIELPRSGRRARTGQGGRACEACGRPLKDDAPSGALPRLAFCAECQVRMDLLAHPIHFCDRCGISVPVDLVEGGTALSADGRILCQPCRAAEPALFRSVMVTALVLALLAAAIGVAFALLV